MPLPSTQPAARNGNGAAGASSMVNAMKDAGVPLPSNQERIWNWVRDHPDKSVAEIMKGIKITTSSVSSLVSQMAQRKMVTRTEDKRQTGRGHTTVYVYRVATKEYVLLPLPKKAPDAESKTRRAAKVPAAPPMTPIQQAEAQADAILANTSIVLGRILFNRLAALFASDFTKAH